MAAKPRYTIPSPDLRLIPGAGVVWLLVWAGLVVPARAVLILAGVLTALLVLAVGAAIVHDRRARLFAGRPGSVPAEEIADFRAGRRRGRRVADGPGHAGRGPGCHRPRTPLVAWCAGGLLLFALTAPVTALTGARLAQRERDPLTVAASEGRTVVFEGRVSGDPKELAAQSFGGGSRFLVRLKVSRVEVRGQASPSAAQLVVFGSGGWGELVAGEHVISSGRLRPAGRGVAEAAVTFARAGPVVRDSGSWPWRFAEHLREGLREACAGLPRDARGLLPALVVGDTSGLDPDLRNDLQAGGLTHLTAVSGSNCAILGGITFLVIGALGGGRRVRAAGTLCAIVGFVVLARPEPSVLRAAVMGTLALVGALLARPGAGVPMLAATVVVLLGADPWLARSFGFALSVLATAGLLLLVPAWLYRLRRWPRGAVLAVSVPLAAQVVTAPVTVLLNPVVSLVAVPANLLAGVAVAPATVAGVGAAALSLVWPGGAALVAWCGGVATQWIAVVAHRAAAVPAGSLPWPDGVAGAGLLAALTLVGATLLVRRAWRTAVLLPPVVAVCLMLPRWVPVLPGSGPPDDWVVVQCDVGQGSATAIRSGPDRAVLVDAGPDPTLVDRCLRRLGVRHLDLVLVTHFHADHADGLDGALAGRGGPPVFVSPVARPGAQARDVTRSVHSVSVGRAPVPVTTELTGTAGTEDWRVRWQLFPPGGSAVRSGLAAGAEAEGPQINNVSVVLLAEVRGVRVAALGDVEPEAQRALLRALTGRAGPVDVVVLAHHGSANQEERLYRFLHPRVALIGVGAGNDYGHPAPAALALLRRIGTVAFRTDTQGEIAVTGTPDDLRVVTSR